MRVKMALAFGLTLKRKGAGGSVKQVRIQMDDSQTDQLDIK